MSKRHYQINELKPGLKLIQRLNYHSYQQSYQRFYHIYKIRKISPDGIMVKSVDLKLRKLETIFEFEVWWNEIRDVGDLKNYRKLRINETFIYKVNNNIK